MMNKLFSPVLYCALTALLVSEPAIAGDKGMLRIATEPGDALISINGKPKGNSPTEVGQSFAIKLDEGEYQVQAFKPDGLKEYFGEKKVFVADDTMQTITLKLQERASEAGKQAIATEERAAQVAKGALAEKERTAKQVLANYIPAPEMVALKAGKFRRSCLKGEQNCSDDEKTAPEITVSAFEIGKYEVTFDLWDACYAQGGCKKHPNDQGWGRGSRPVINVSWNDIQDFLVWINQKTGKQYRLPTVAEWNYAARAGTKTNYSWGDVVGKNRANCVGCGSKWDNKQTAPVGSFAANPWGLHDMHGNVSEWLNDWCGGSDYYQSCPSDNPTGPSSGSARAQLGGGWDGSQWYMRPAELGGASPDVADKVTGFRLVLPSSASNK